MFSKLKKDNFSINNVKNFIKENKDKIDIEGIKKLIEQKSKDLKESLELVVEDPSISANAKANIIINATSLTCAIIAVQPLPFADLFILSPIQVVMVTYLGKVLGLKTDNTTANEILVYLIGTLGWGVLSQQTVIALYKTVIPYAGGFTTIPLVYASTFGLGIACKTLIKSKIDNVSISKEELKRIREEAFNEAKNQNKDWSVENLKSQLTSIVRQEFKVYKEELNNYDKVINKDKEFSIDDLDNKKKLLINRFSKYHNVVLSEKAIYKISFMNKDIIINDIENIISKIHRNEIDISFDKYLNAYYNIKNICELHINKNNEKFFVNDINIFDSNLEELINVFSNDSKQIHMKDKQIREKFIEAIESSNYELNISSPWMTFNVVDYYLVDKMRECLKRGATIKIIYGIGSGSSYFGVDKRDLKSDEVAEYLKNEFQSFGNRFKIKKVNSHYKLVICDEKFLLEGSYNFLSFKGDYIDDVRGEGATYNTNLDMIRNLRNLYFDF